MGLFEFFGDVLVVRFVPFLVF